MCRKKRLFFGFQPAKVTLRTGSNGGISRSWQDCWTHLCVVKGGMVGLGQRIENLVLSESIP